jgi:hypothetical protein
MNILAIDPGNTHSAFVVYDTGGKRRVHAEKLTNRELLSLLEGDNTDLNWYPLAIEMIASYGMPVGAEVFETCLWIGRFIQAHGGPHIKVYRRDVKLHLCGSSRAKDPNVRQALIDLVGPQGTKKQPGPTYGLKADMWAALGVAVTAAQDLSWAMPEQEPTAPASSEPEPMGIVHQW